MTFQKLSDFVKNQCQLYSGATRHYIGVTSKYRKLLENSEEELEDVITWLRNTEREKNQPNDPSTSSLCDSGSVPCYEDTPPLYLEHKLGKCYRRQVSKWGTFVIIPEDDLKDGFGVEKGCEAITPPLLFYLKNVNPYKNIAVKLWGKWALKLPVIVQEGYNEWVPSLSTDI